MVTAGKDAASQGFSFCHAIHPTHSVLVFPVRLSREVEEFIYIAEVDVFCINPRAVDGSQLYFGPSYDSGEPKATNRCFEPIGILLWRTERTLAVRSQQFESTYVTTEGPRAMVVLPMDVIGDCAANRNKLCTWSHRYKPSFRNNQGKKIA